MIRSAVLLVLIPIYTAVASLLAVPVALLTRSPTILYVLGRFGVRLGLKIAGVRIVGVHREKLPENPHFIYMINHSSNLDGPAAIMQIPGEIKALGKKEVFALPILGTVLRIAGFISVDRRNRPAAIRSMQQAAEKARAGASFFIAPEGTRSWNGKLQPFKKGGFHLAIDSGVSILPVTVRGARKLMPRGSFAIRPGLVEVVFHDPVPTRGLLRDDLERLVAEVRGRIASALEPEYQAA